MTVTTLSDDIAEGTELFEATLMLFLGVPRVTVAPDVAPIQILDEDGMSIVRRFVQMSFRTHNSSLEGAMKLKFAPFCSS